MKKKLLYLIPLVIIGILIGLVFNKPTETKSQLSYLDIKLASYEDVQDGDNVVEGTDSVKFDAYFSIDKDNDGIVDKIRGNCVQTTKSTKLNIDLNVIGGVTLENTRISFVNNNVVVSYYDYRNGSVYLGNVDSGTNNDFRVTLDSRITNDITSYSQINKVILTGTVNANGIKTEITKEVDYTLDWYRSGIATSLEGNTPTVKIENDIITVTYTYSTRVYDAKLLKSANYNVKIPELNGVKPTSVQFVGTNYDYDYDEANSRMTIVRNAELNETKIINAAYDYHESSAVNSMQIVLQYPLEAGLRDTLLPLTVEAWHELYNNQSEEFESILTSTHVTKVFSARIKLTEEEQTSVNEGGPIPFIFSAKTDSYLGNWVGIDKTPVINKYDGIESEDTTDYDLTLYTSLFYTYGTVEKVIVYDNSYDTFDGSVSLGNYVRYKTISFEGVSALGENGYIKVINADTDETIHIFTKDDWNQVFEFEEDVRKIYIETSSVEKILPVLCRDKTACNYASFLTTRITKEIDNNALASAFTREQIEGFETIRTSQSTTMVMSHDNRTHNQDRPNISNDWTGYILPKSTYLNIKLNKDLLIIAEEQNVRFIVEATEAQHSSYDIYREWINGEFIVAFPKEVLSAKVSNVSTDNYKVKLLGYELVEQDGVLLLKIKTSNDSPEHFKIYFDASLYVDPRITSNFIPFTVYGANKGVRLSEYTLIDKYDVDNDNNTTEAANCDSVNVSVDDDNTNSIKTLTVFKLKNNNNEERTVVSPNVAEVNPFTDNDTATVELSLINRSREQINNIEILGRLGYENNKYILTDTDLNSKFDLLMTADGITVPSVIQDKTTIYYSDVETPTKDINDLTNNWKTKDQVSNFDSIKSYLIIVDDYTLNIKDYLTFTYNVKMPMDTSYINKGSYLTDAIYYDRLTDAGVIPANPIEPKKNGIMLMRRYDLNVDTYKAYGNKELYADYSLVDEDGNSYIVGSDKNAIGLYVGKTYILKQISSTGIIDDEEKTFKVINPGADSTLTLSGEEVGTYKSISINNTILNIQIENEVQYTLTLTNKELGSDILVPKMTYKITGKGYEEGKTLTTNINGELFLGNMYLGEEYTIEQISSGEYLKFPDPFKIYLGRNPVTHEVTIQQLTEYPYGYGSAVSLSSNSSCGFTGSGSFQSINNRDANCNDEGYVELDLTDYYLQYRVGYSVYARNYGDYYKLFAVTDINHIPDNIAESETPTYPYDTGFLTTAYNYNASTNSYEEVPIVGGNKYYIYMYARRTGYYTYNTTTISLDRLAQLNGAISEYKPLSEKVDVPVDTNPNVLQTVVDNDNIVRPELLLTVRSPKEPTYTLEVTKLSADTKEPLGGAQFKLLGEGLPSTGKYIKTDENGKATIKLKEEWYLSTSVPNGYNLFFNSTDYSTINGSYTIEEIIPPEGYQLDTKVIGFTLKKQFNTTDCTRNGSKYNCTVADNTDHSYVVDYKNVTNQFVEYEFDDATNTLKVTVYDYPLITLIKKDNETGVLLPNTLFAIYEVSTGNNGVEVLTPAKDSKGNVLGYEVTIDGITYNVLKTDENGKLIIPLTNGDYKAIEVQASDEKYQIDDKGYYFSVGPTVEFGDGVTFYDSFNIKDYHNHYWWYSMNNMISTSDGGYLLDTGNYGEDVNIIKLDKNFNVEWKLKADQKRILTYTESHAYYDKDEVITETKVDSRSDYFVIEFKRELFEVEEGYIVNFVPNSNNCNFRTMKIDKNGNFVSYYYNENHCGGQSSMYIKYTAACRKDNGKFVGLSDYLNYYGSYPNNKIPYDPDNQYIQRDEDTYYCYTGAIYDAVTGELRYARSYDGGVSYHINENNNSHIYSNYAIDSKGYSYYISGDSNNSHSTNYGSNFTNYLLADGTYKSFDLGDTDWSNLNGQYCLIGTQVENNPGHPENGTHIENMNYSADNCNLDPYNAYPEIEKSRLAEFRGRNIIGNFQILRFDKEGNFIGVNDINVYFKKAMEMYNAEHGTDYDWVGGSSGGVSSSIYKLYTFANDDLLVFNNANGLIRLRYNEQTKQYDIIYYIRLIGLYEQMVANVYYLDFDFIIDGNAFYYKLADYGDSGYFNFSKNIIYRYDENGNFEKQIDYLSKFGNDISTYLNSFTRYNRGANISYVKLNDDKYIIFMTEVDNYRNLIDYDVELESGEVVTIKVGGYDGTNSEHYMSRITVFEVDSDANVQWIKQYEGFDYDTYFDRTTEFYAPVINPAVSADGTKIILPVNSLANGNNKMVDLQTGDVYSLKGNMFIFNVADESKPESPEAYSLEIPNVRKTYKITIDSKEHGTTEILNGSSSIRTINNEEVEVENIKYGDNSVYTIKAYGEDGYYVDTVMVNGDEYPFSVLDDGSVVLEGLNDIKENKNITITFKPGAAIVIVHHYKNGTTDRIVSDELLSGNVDEDYETEPAYNRLYRLTKDANDNAVLPDNYKGTFKSTLTVVSYYYDPNEVDLKVNYYLKNTTIELSPSTVETKLLGSTYKTSPKDIDFYELVDVIGNEEGTLDQLETEVTYMYQEVGDVVITVKYIDKDTNREILDDKIITVKRYDSYETEPVVIDGYELYDKTSNYKGIANQANIEVVYYYIKPEVKGSPKTGDKIYKYVGMFIISLLGISIIYKKYKTHC